MAVLSGITPTPHHRQNRRRERPGSRTRRTVTRKANVLMYDRDEGLLDAQDLTVYLPSDNTQPSPILRQNFDQSWQRWQARKTEERALAEMEQMKMEEEQLRLFGGDVGDDVSLIPDTAMLDVVMSLFGGIDYIDP